MAQFFPLRVTDIKRDTKNSVVLSLAPESKDEGAFDYLPGQYLTFKKQFGDEELRRSYSICSSARDNTLRVGIKKVDGGGFSTWANEALRVGETIEAMAPMGAFTVDPAAAKDAHYLGVAVGSGITPILSIAKTLLEENPTSSFHLIYGNRSLGSIMFREEVEDLKNRFLARFSVNHVLSGGADLELFSGRIDAEKCAQFFGSLISPATLEQAFICGPEDMMNTVSGTLETGDMARSNIKFELFGASQQGRLAARAKSAVAKAAVTSCEATVIIDGVKHDLPMSGETSVLDAAVAANIDAPFACKAGVCSTCRARVVEGDYEFVTNYALEDYEVEQGYVLSCQCFPTGDKLVITYDDH